MLGVLGVLASDAPSRLEIASSPGSKCAWCWATPARCSLLAVVLRLIDASTSTSIVLSSIASKFDGVVDSNFATREGMTASWEVPRLALANDWTFGQRQGTSSTGTQHMG